MHKKIILILISILFISGCTSLMDPNRGMFVSSKVQTIELENFSETSKIFVAPFEYKKAPESATTTSTAMVGSSFIPISHHLQFDSVDRDYLYQSITTSFEKGGATVVDNPEDADKVVSVSFNTIGMVRMGSGLAAGVYPYFDADVEIHTSEKIINSKNITAKGSAMSMSVASSKNHAIKQFVLQVSQLL